MRDGEKNVAEGEAVGIGKLKCGVSMYTAYMLYFRMYIFKGKKKQHHRCCIGI